MPENGVRIGRGQRESLHAGSTVYLVPVLRTSRKRKDRRITTSEGGGESFKGLLGEL